MKTIIINNPNLIFVEFTIIADANVIKLTADEAQFIADSINNSKHDNQTFTLDIPKRVITRAPYKGETYRAPYEADVDEIDAYNARHQAD